eukprot:1149544-Pelagomonas_calceolata.AAC.2
MRIKSHQQNDGMQASCQVCMGSLPEPSQGVVLACGSHLVSMRCIIGCMPPGKPVNVTCLSCSKGSCLPVGRTWSACAV